MRRLLPLILLLAACSAPAPRVPYADAETAMAFERGSVELGSVEHGSVEFGPAAMADDDDRPGLAHTLLFYIPNRIFDVFDIVRARARFGPGFGIGAQLTRLIGAHADWYTAVWIGLPGPRLEPALPIPVGTEAVVKASVTFLRDWGLGTAGDRLYGYGEFELEAQFIILGADVGLDPWEFVDLALGLITLDPVGDDM